MIVYGQITGRTVPVEYVLELEKRFSSVFDVKPVYLYAPAEVLVERMKKSNSEQYKEITSIFQIERILTEFNYWIQNYSNWKWYYLTTHEKTPEETVDRIIEVLLL